MMSAAVFVTFMNLFLKKQRFINENIPKMFPCFLSISCFFVFIVFLVVGSLGCLIERR